MANSTDSKTKTEAAAASDSAAGGEQEEKGAAAAAAANEKKHDNVGAADLEKVQRHQMMQQS